MEEGEGQRYRIISNIKGLWRAEENLDWRILGHKG